MMRTEESHMPKKLRCIRRDAGRHWVGDGFPVRTLFAYPSHGSVLSPFLLLDYAGPMKFETHERASRGGRASASWVRDGDHRLRR